MPKPTYSLEALEKLRETQVDDATKALGEAVRAREAATARRQQAEATIEAKRQAFETMRVEEWKKLQGGGADAHDLALGNAWEIGARAELVQLADAVTKRKEEETLAMQKEAEARAKVALKRADADVVRKDHDRFDAGVRKAELAKEEEAAEEAWRKKG